MMKNEVLRHFAKNLIGYGILLLLLLLIAKKAGWENASIADNAIGLTVAWVAWKLIMLMRKRKDK